MIQEVGRETVVYDSCVLYSLTTCRFLVWAAAEVPLVRARYSSKIVSDVRAKLAEHGRSLAVREAVAELLRSVPPDAIVRDWEKCLGDFGLRDPDDHHVVAVARCSGATRIVTSDQDFEPQVLEPWGITPVHPDAFLCEKGARSPGALATFVARQSDRDHLPLKLEKSDLSGFAEVVRSVPTEGG